MWSFRLMRENQFAVCLIAVLALSACTIEPLNRSQPDSAIAGGSASASLNAILAATTVSPVNTRVAQQVRNALLFELNGGSPKPNGQYNVKLTVKSNASSVSIESSVNTPTSSQVRVTVRYYLIDTSSGSTVATGTRSALASYDKTPQSFANQRASREANNRAAKEVARHVRLAVGQTIAGL